MSDDLFRDEALEYQSASNSRFGKPTGVLPPSWGIITLMLGMFIGALIIFLVNVDFARKETVRGKLRVDGAEAKLYPLEAGLISKVLVQDGDVVVEGQALIEITKERFMQDGEALSDATLKQLETELETLKRRREATITAANVGVAQAEQSRKDAERREQEYRAQLSIVRDRLRIARQRANDAREFLREGLIAEPQLNERLDTVSIVHQTVLQTEAQLGAAKAAQSQAILDNRQLRANRDRDLAEVDQRLNQIDSQIQRTQADTAYVINAPISGRVTALQARTGEQALTGLPLAIILPQDSTLIAEVFLPSRAIGFVETGQEVKLQYDAFPYQKFGVAYGEIFSVASTAQLPQEMGVPSQTGEPIYRVGIELQSQSIMAFSKDVPLQAGMELTADIVLENRRLLEWLLEPLKS